MSHRIVMICGLLLLATGPQALSRELAIPTFPHLENKATEVVEFDMNSLTAALAGKLTQQADQKRIDPLTMLKGASDMRVHVYEFAADDAYLPEDVDVVRSQLSADGWKAIAQVHSRNPQEIVDVYVSRDGENINGIAIVAAEPREFVVLNATGSFAAADVEKLRQQYEAGAQ